MRPTPLLIVVASLSAFAQEDDVDTTVTAPGIQMNVNMKVRGPAAQPLRRQPVVTAAAPVGEVSNECAPANGIAPQTIKVVGFDGALAQVYAEDGSLEGQFTVPFNFKGRGDTYYRFVIQAADGALLLDRKLEAKLYVGCLARLGAGRGPSPAPAQPSAGGMSPADFDALLEAVNGEGFSDGKLRVIATAAQGASFSVSQVGRLIDALDFSADKLKALELLRLRIVDRKNNFRLLERFTFSADKAKAQALLR